MTIAHLGAFHLGGKRQMEVCAIPYRLSRTIGFGYRRSWRLSCRDDPADRLLRAPTFSTAPVSAPRRRLGEPMGFAVSLQEKTRACPSRVSYGMGDIRHAGTAVSPGLVTCPHSETRPAHLLDYPRGLEYAIIHETVVEVHLFRARPPRRAYG